MMADLATADQARRMIDAIDEHLETPFGPMVLAPAYTAMRENIGRLTQKHPGVAENGSVYNHAVSFYVYALLERGEADRAFDLVKRMIPGPDENDLRIRGQLPAFVPNYYRGAVHQLPRTAGRSSQLFNTGAASWLYRSIIEGVFGLRGCRDGLCIDPALPGGWAEARAERRFRGGLVRVRYRRDAATDSIRIVADGEAIDTRIVAVAPGQTVDVEVLLPAAI
jgi:cellobionic acid phosphorylase